MGVYKGTAHLVAVNKAGLSPGEIGCHVRLSTVACFSKRLSKLSRKSLSAEYLFWRIFSQRYSPPESESGALVIRYLPPDHSLTSPLAVDLIAPIRPLERPPFFS